MCGHRLPKTGGNDDNDDDNVGDDDGDSDGDACDDENEDKDFFFGCVFEARYCVRDAQCRELRFLMF